MDATTLAAVITIVTPAIIGLIKLVAPKIPKGLPLILAPVLGAGLEVADALLSGHPPSGASGLLYGALGVYVREIVDQLRKLPESAKPIASVLAIIGLAGMLNGCAYLKSPFEPTDQNVLWAGDAGGALCLGVVLGSHDKDQPGWIEDAKKASAAARGVLGTSPADYSKFVEAVSPIVPAAYRPGLVFFLDRFQAHVPLGVIEPGTTGEAMAKAFLDSCDAQLSAA